MSRGLRNATGGWANLGATSNVGGRFPHLHYRNFCDWAIGPKDTCHLRLPATSVSAEGAWSTLADGAGPINYAVTESSARRCNSNYSIGTPGPPCLGGEGAGGLAEPLTGRNTSTQFASGRHPGGGRAEPAQDDNQRER